MAAAGGKLETILDRKHISLMRRGHWEYVSRKGVCGIVAIVAVTGDRKLVLVEQYRPPVDSNVIELPAGLAGDLPGQSNEALESAARRELLEETGYEAAAMRAVAEGTGSAGITDEVISLFVATGLKKTGDGAGDGSEQITLHEVPLAEVENWLAQQRKAGKLNDLKVYAGLCFAKR